MLCKTTLVLARSRTPQVTSSPHRSRGSRRRRRVSSRCPPTTASPSPTRPEPTLIPSPASHGSLFPFIPPIRPRARLSRISSVGSSPRARVKSHLSPMRRSLRALRKRYSRPSIPYSRSRRTVWPLRRTVRPLQFGGGGGPLHERTDRILVHRGTRLPAD